MWGEQLLLVVSVLLPGALGYIEKFQLTGVCPFVNYLNGLTFEMQGRTANGAPYYKAVDQNTYMYYDPNCGASLDGTPRWIIDNDKPSLTRAHDFDGDTNCVNIAFVDSGDKTQPPQSLTWRMQCSSASGYQNVQLRLTGIVTVSETFTTTTTTTTIGGAFILQLDGACAYLNYLNGMVFRKAGSTASGAPFYKSDYKEYYIYYDPNCAHVFSGVPRWIIDNDKPSTTAVDDLDNDKNCNYQARVDSFDTLQPPANASWTMQCNFGAAPREQHRLTFLAFTTTSTVTSSTATGITSTTFANNAPIESATTAKVMQSIGATNATVAPQALLLSGACIEQSFLNGLTFLKLGTTANGAPFYKGVHRVVFIYHDPDCSGAGSPARWIIDSSEPDTRKKNDFDGDSSCTYLARMDSADASMPPANSTWRMNCGSSWKDQKISLAPVIGFQSTHFHTPVLSGACDYMSGLNGVGFQMIGKTASGAPFYKAGEEEWYIYFDPDCAGRVGKPSPPRWIIDNNAPSTERETDLDADSECNYLARIISNDTSTPPSAAKWLMFCGAGWQEVSLTLTEEYVMVSNGTAVDSQSLVSAAVGMHQRLVALFPLLFTPIVLLLSPCSFFP